MFDVGNLVIGVATPASIQRLDLIDDYTINAADITEWLSQAATANGHGSPYLRGDTDLDRDIDITDFNSLSGNFDAVGDGDPTNGPYWNEGNFAGDDDVDITDFNYLSTNFASSGYGRSAVPEPNAWIVIAVGVVILLARRKHKCSERE